MCGGASGVQYEPVPGVGLHGDPRQQFGPCAVVVAVCGSGVDRAQAHPSWCVTDVVAGVDLDVAWASGRSEGEHRKVVAVAASARVLPTFAHVPGPAGKDDVRRKGIERVRAADQPTTVFRGQQVHGPVEEPWIRYYHAAVKSCVVMILLHVSW
jgi:hypothetical protein